VRAGAGAGAALHNACDLERGWRPLGMPAVGSLVCAPGLLTLPTLLDMQAPTPPLARFLRAAPQPARSALFMALSVRVCARVQRPCAWSRRRPAACAACRRSSSSWGPRPQCSDAASLAARRGRAAHAHVAPAGLFFREQRAAGCQLGLAACGPCGSSCCTLGCAMMQLPVPLMWDARSSRTKAHCWAWARVLRRHAMGWADVPMACMSQRVEPLVA